MNKNKDLKVELLRIISILLVIANHSVLNLYFGNPYKYLPLEAITLMGVTIFFIITGFFLYRHNNNTHKVYINYLSRIFIPFSIFCIIVIIFEKAITCESSVIDVIKNINIIESIKIYYAGIKHWTCTNWTYLLGHTWYIFDYTIIIILFPISYHIVNRLNKGFVYTLCFLFILYIIYVDISMPQGLQIYIMSRNIPKVVFLSILGHLFYNEFLPFFRNKLFLSAKNILKNRIISISILSIIYIIIVYCLTRIQFFYDSINNENQHFPYYFRQESFLMILMSFLFILIFFVVIDLVEDKVLNNYSVEKKDKISRIIIFFSKKTFLVYLIHSELIVISMNTGLFKLFSNDNELIQIILNIIYVIIIYLLSIFIAYVVELVSFIKN